MSIPGAASPLFLSAAAAPAGAFQIDRSLRFNSADSAYLNRTPSSAGNRKTWTYSTWIKRSNLTAGDYVHIFGHYVSDYTLLVFKTGDDRLQFWTNFGAAPVLETSAVLRDPSAWYHIVLAVDTTQSTASDRAHIYINGVEAAYDVDQRSSQLTQNLDTYINNTNVHEIGGNPTGGGNTPRYFNGYLAENYLIDGQQLAPTDFGEYDDNNNWNPKAYSGSYGTNGFHLDFSDNSSASNLGTDSSGNSNTWTVNNLSVASGSGNDSLIDTPTNYTADSGNNGGNYCTWNFLDNAGTLANGNLDFSNSAASNQGVRSTFALPDSGKWYAEFTTGELTSSSKGVAFGFANSSAGLTDGPNSSNRWVIYAGGVGYIFANGSTLTSSLGTFAAGTLLQIAYDADTGKAWVGKNNTWYNSSGGTTGNPSSGTNQTFTLSGTIFLYALCYANSGVLNAGQRPFAYTPPTGYLSLCTENLPDPTIADGSTAMNATTYTGNGSTQAVTGLNHSPDFAWIKHRTRSQSHVIYDIVRGAGTGKSLSSNSSGAEGGASDGTVYGYLSAFDSDGFTVIDGSDAEDYVNKSGAPYIAWTWDGGSSTSSNSDGSITSNVRANASAGFSIVSYTGNSTVGATVGHGLNDVPGLVIIKNRTTGSLPWVIKTTGMTGGQRLQFDTGAVYTEAAGTGSVWNATNPSSSVITLGDINYSNASSNNYIGYCWVPVSGYSAFGSYTAGGTSDDAFVFTGMRPKLIMIKALSSAGDMSYASWLMVDSERDTYNVSDAGLFANLAAAEGTRGNGTGSAGTWLDILSNGFKIRYNGSEVNGVSGQTYVYCAWAEHPFKTARAR